VREETGRTEEPPVGVSRAMLTAVFVTQKLRYITTFGNANIYPRPILTPLLNILDFALRAAYNRHS
jgi:hypothetical protein